MPDIMDLHMALRGAGLNIEGVSDPGPEAYITGWVTEPTKDDLALAESILKSFDWSDRPTKTEEQIKTEISVLTPDQRMKLVDRLLIDLALAKPEVFESAKEATLGIKG